MLDDVKWGAKWGLLGGSVLGCFTALILLVKEDLPPVSPFAIVFSYPIAGLVAGILVGFLRPLLTSRRNSVLIGALVGIVVMSLLMPLAIGPPTNWGLAEVASVVLTGLILGSYAGHRWWNLLTD